MHVTIADIEERDRPRERLVRSGPSALSDSELVGILLGSGGRGRNAVDVAHALISRAGGLAALSRCSPEEMSSVPSVGLAKASSVAAAFELGRRAPLATGLLRKVRDAGDLAAVVREKVGDHSREEVFVVALDDGLRVLRVERLTVGTDSRCLLEPRDVLASVLKAGGTRFAVAHTHPSGEVQASSEDRRATGSLARAADTVGLQLVDHLIVTEKRWSSVSAT